LGEVKSEEGSGTWEFLPTYTKHSMKTITPMKILLILSSVEDNKKEEGFYQPSSFYYNPF
jgi:hypothetical protein